MKKKIWIFNHYAGPPSICSGLRHYNFGKCLIEAGYDVTIFVSSAIQNSSKNIIENNDSYRIEDSEGVPFVYIKTRQYSGNGKERVLNMLDYYRELLKITKDFEKPDVIIGSSVHPLACLAAIKLSEKYNCKNIVEIRDLWPESLIEYGIIKKDTLLAKALYRGEKYLYTKADNLVFTMEGGKQYIIDRGWDTDHGGSINVNQVHHINNGIVLEDFDYNKEHYQIEDDDLLNKDLFKVVYIGSIRKVNNLAIIVDVAKELKQKKYTNIQILVYGDGDERAMLEKRCAEEKLKNIVFKGRVDKKYIPYILSQCDLNLMHNGPMKIGRYGLSLNKSFDYLASGKPILSDIACNYDYIVSGGAGLNVECTVEKITNGILEISQMSFKDYQCMCERAREIAWQYDFKQLTEKLIKIIEK